MKEHSHRTERIADQIRQQLAELLERELKDPRVGFVTITNVAVTRDLRTARVGISVMGNDAQRKQSLEGLAAAQGFLRHELGHRLGLRHTPQLSFEMDRAVAAERRVEELLRQMRRN